ncbi:hypothetical protein [Neisseria subflava]|uniref:hypothetical protein n=1 Tax=Neisseria subflava TaxID=28449 RepID=UPI001CB6FBCD
MFTQKKSPITHFVLTGICAAVLAACASSNGEPGSPTSPSVAPNDISNNTNKGSSNKDNANKPTTGKDNAGKDNATKPNTGKDNAGKDNVNKPTTGKDNAGKDNASKPNTGKDNAGKDNANKPTTGKDNVGKDNATKPTIGKDNAGKDNTNKPNTGKDNAGKDNATKPSTGKDNAGKDNASKPNTGKDNLAQINEQISKNIQNKLVTLRLNDTVEKEGYKFAEFSQAEVDTGFIANNFAANPLLEKASENTFVYDSAHIIETSGGRGKYKLLRPQTVILGGVATRYKINKIDGYIKREYGYDEIDTPLNSKNLIGVDKRNANGILIKQGSSVNILDQAASKFELDSVGGSRYTQWFNNFETNADNKTSLDKGRRVLADVEYKLDDKGNPIWNISTKPSKGYQYAHSLNNYFDNNPDDELYVNQNGEYAYRFTLDKTTTFKVSSEAAKVNPERADALKALGWVADKQYTYSAGSYFLVTQKDGRLKIVADKGQMTEVSLYSIHTGIDNNKALGAFQNKRVIAEMFSALHYGKVNEVRAIYTYDVGQANGFNQQYLSLTAWRYKNGDGTYGVNTPFNIGIFNRVITENGMVANVYDMKTKKGLSAKYTGVAYSSRDGKQDGVMNMTAQFHEPNMAYNTVLSNNVTFNGAITNRRLDDKRDVYFASGNVKTESGMPSTTAGQKVSLVGGSPLSGDITVWMKGKNPGENKVIYGKGDIRFAGPNAEEVGGVLKITTSHGENNIGFVGKR